MGKMFRLIAISALAISSQAALPGIADAKGGMTGGYAVVMPDGTLGRNKNVAGVSHPSTGVYRVTFTDQTGKCAYAGTIAGNPHTLLPGYIVVSHSDKPSKDVIVSTFATLTLLPADFRFHLIVTC